MQHGGKREPSPGKKLGRPKKEPAEKFKKIHISISPAEYIRLAAAISTSGMTQREILVAGIEAAENRFPQDREIHDSEFL